MRSFSGSTYLFLCICLVCIMAVGLFFKIAPVSQGENGYVLIWENDGLFVKTNSGEFLSPDNDINFYSLPDTDRERLKNGIRVSTGEELISLIEDFSG